MLRQTSWASSLTRHQKIAKLSKMTTFRIILSAALIAVSDSHLNNRLTTAWMTTRIWILMKLQSTEFLSLEIRYPYILSLANDRVSCWMTSENKRFHSGQPSGPKMSFPFVSRTAAKSTSLDYSRHRTAQFSKSVPYLTDDSQLKM